MTDSFLNGVLFVGGSMLLAVAGLVLAHRRIDMDRLKRHHEVANYFFSMIGTLYSVLIAFAIFLVWSSFAQAGTNLELEANEVGDLSRISAVMPDPLRENIRTALIEYLASVMDDEFPAMSEGRSSQRTWNAVEKLWGVYDTAELNSPKMQLGYAESLKHLNELSDYRRTRLFSSGGSVPASLWSLLVLGGIVLVAFTYFFGHDSSGAQAAMTAALAGMLAFSCFIILSLDRPYSGVARVAPAAFMLELAHVSAR